VCCWCQNYGHYGTRNTGFLSVGLPQNDVGRPDSSRLSDMAMNSSALVESEKAIAFQALTSVGSRETR